MTLIESLAESPTTLRLTIAELLALSLPYSEQKLVESALMEASIRQLWAKAIRAFPKTKRRQHVIDRVRTETVKWQPFPKLRIILASSKVLGEKHPNLRQKRYRTNLMFRNVVFSETAKRGLLKIKSRGKTPSRPGGNLFFEKLSFNDSVRVRCNCPDFRWRFNWECESESPSALFGPKAPPYTPPHPERYRGPANPSGLAGICKHVMATGLALHKAGAIKIR